MSGYIGNIPVPQATQTRDSFVATEGQTSFATGGYDVGFLDVYLNGVKLASSDYIATNGSDVVLTTGAAANDVVDVVAFSTFEIGSNVDNASVATQSLVVDRQSTDGTIIDLQKDGTTVGSIGTQASTVYIGKNETAAQFIAGSVDRIVPFNSTTQSFNDGGISLGYTDARWNSLFLSGGVYLGGTGSANYLDDYETGTFTPTINLLGTLNYFQQTGIYTKVGNLVTCHVDVVVSSDNTTQESLNLKIEGLPFTSNQSALCGSVITEGYTSQNSAVMSLHPFIYAADNGIYIFNENYNGVISGKTQYFASYKTVYTGGNLYLRCIVTYQVA